jgi:hypothetical protein
MSAAAATFSPFTIPIAQKNHHYGFLILIYSREDPSRNPSNKLSNIERLYR